MFTRPLLFWSGCPLLPLLLTTVFALGLAGCGPQTFSKSYPAASSLEAPVTGDVQKQVQQLVARFISDVQRKDYSQACSMMSPTLRSQLPPAKLEKEMQGPYRPLSGAGQWQFDLTQYLAHGDKIVVHTHFIGAGGAVYRTNLAFVKEGQSWLIDMILPPSKPSHPFATSAKPLSVPSH